MPELGPDGMRKLLRRRKESVSKDRQRALALFFGVVIGMAKDYGITRAEFIRFGRLLWSHVHD